MTNPGRNELSETILLVQYFRDMIIFFFFSNKI